VRLRWARGRDRPLARDWREEDDQPFQDPLPWHGGKGSGSYIGRWPKHTEPQPYPANSSENPKYIRLSIPRKTPIPQFPKSCDNFHVSAIDFLGLQQEAKKGFVKCGRGRMRAERWRNSYCSLLANYCHLDWLDLPIFFTTPTVTSQPRTSNVFAALKRIA
jgi:hypothetical protein